jgi:hypothetical protein
MTAMERGGSEIAYRRADALVHAARRRCAGERQTVAQPVRPPDAIATWAASGASSARRMTW